MDSTNYNTHTIDLLSAICGIKPNLLYNYTFDMCNRHLAWCTFNVLILTVSIIFIHRRNLLNNVRHKYDNILKPLMFVTFYLTMAMWTALSIATYYLILNYGKQQSMTIHIAYLTYPTLCIIIIFSSILVILNLNRKYKNKIIDTVIQSSTSKQ